MDKRLYFTTIIVFFASYVIFRGSAQGARWLSPIATKVVTRIVGLLLAAVAVQFMINGLKGGTHGLGPTVTRRPPGFLAFGWFMVNLSA